MGPSDCLSKGVKNKILISKTAIGSTFKKRLLSHLKDVPSYDYFDIDEYLYLSNNCD